MSYYESIETGAIDTVASYVGLDNETPASFNNFELRINSANFIQIRAIAGFERIEAFRFGMAGGGTGNGSNLDDLILNQSWVSIGAIGTDGSEQITIPITRSNVGDTSFWMASIWHPASDKVAIAVKQMRKAQALPASPTPMFNALALSQSFATGILLSTIDTVSSGVPYSALGLGAMIHRITGGDNIVTNTFSGQTYSAAEGWVPSVMGDRFTAPSEAYTAVGLNWRINAAGNWELYGDVIGVIETGRVIDILFQKFNPSQLTRFGTFN